MARDVFKNIKNKVLELYPNASILNSDSGNFYVSDGIGNKLKYDYLIPPQPTAKLAWYWFFIIIQADKIIKISHPYNMSLDLFQKKFKRILKRSKTK
jgi:hypothetical protein